MTMKRRTLITGLISFIAAPATVAANESPTFIEVWGMDYSLPPQCTLYRVGQDRPDFEATQLMRATVKRCYEESCQIPSLTTALALKKQK